MYKGVGQKLDKTLRRMLVIVVSFMLLSGCKIAVSPGKNNLNISNTENSQDMLKVWEEKKDAVKSEQEIKLQAAKVEEEKKKEAASQENKANIKTTVSKPKKQSSTTKPSSSKTSNTGVKTAEVTKTTVITNVIIPKTSSQKIVSKTGVPEIPFNYSYTFFSEIEQEVLIYVNKEREAAGLDPLIWDEKLRDIAEYKANEMLQYQYFSHTSPVTGGPMNLAVDYFKYETNGFGENLLYYYGSSDHNMVSAERMVQDWMNSPPHRENILRPEWKKLGVGVVYSSDKKYTYAVQHFSE
jgi:uncharacterized protein YkwD